MNNLSRSGDNNGRARLTREQALEVCRRYDMLGSSAPSNHKRRYGKVGEIAQAFGISRQCVRKIGTGHLWSSLTGRAPRSAAAKLGVDGSKERTRAFALTVESFSAKELAAHLGKSHIAAQQTAAKVLREGFLFACGRKGKGCRRYTVHSEVADRIDAESARKPMTEVGFRRKLGACLGGLSDDIESLRIRCDIDPEDPDACWIWKGAMSRNGSNARPVPSAQLPTGATGSVRRWVCETFKIKKPLPKGYRTWCKCDEKRCMNTEHMLFGSHKEWGAWIRKTGAWVGKPAFVIANRLKVRSVLTAEVLADIKARGESRADAAVRLGVHYSTVCKAMKKAPGLIPHASIFALRAPMQIKVKPSEKWVQPSRAKPGLKERGWYTLPAPEAPPVELGWKVPA